MPRCPEGGHRRDAPGGRPFRGAVGALAAVAAFTVLGSLVAPRPGGAHADGPPPRNTGGFREPTCALCHRGGEPNAPGGALRLVAPASYRPGAEHAIEVQLERPGLRRGGFHLSVRFAEGTLAGTQAGELLAVAEWVQVVAAHKVAYASHTAAGTQVATAGEARWQLRWKAPAAGGGTVVFHLAANASNDDDSELGDAIYTTALTIPEAAGG